MKQDDDLKTFSTSELVAELKRRFAEMDAARRLLLGRTHAGFAPDAAERPKKVMSAEARAAIGKAKAAWWAKRKAQGKASK